MTISWKTRYSEKPGEAGFIQLWHIYLNNAKQRSYVFEITQENFRKITKMNCHYCDSEPKTLKTNGKTQERRQHNTYIYNGIDRLDNAKGYIDGNVVPCCYDLTSQLVMGNVNDQSLREIWINSKYKNLRDSIKNKKFISICNNCATVKPPVYLIPNWS